jgi:DNA polymerase-4
VTGARTLFGDGETIARRIKQAVKSELDLTCSVGVATNKFLAKLASEMHKPDGLTVVPTTREGIVAFLAPLPIGRLWGVGKATESGLEAAGIRTIGDIQALSDSRLAALVGRHAADHFRRLAFGEDDRVVEPDVEEKSISRETTFAQDCRDPAAVEREYVALVADVAQRLRKQGKRAQLVRLKLRWADFRTLTRQKPLSVPCCDDFTLQAAAKELLDSEPLVHAVRLIGFGVSRLTDEAPPQPDLFAETDRRRERLEAVSHTLDSLRARLGDACIRRGTPSPPRPKADGRTENGKRNE